MKGKNLLILVIALVVLGGAWYLSSRSNQAAWSESKGGGGKVLDFPLNDVARITIKNSAGEVTLKRINDIWTVEQRANYPASFDQVSGLLRKLYELKTVQDVKVGATQMARLELVEPGKADAGKGETAGTLVEFFGADGKPLQGLLVGKKLMSKSEGGGEDQFGGMSAGFAKGRYVKPASGDKVSLVSDSLDELDPKPERWLAKDFVKIETPSSIAVTGATDAQKWTLTRENATGEWKLADAKPDEKVDTGKVSGLNNVFSSAMFNDVLAPEAKLEEPITTAKIDTFDGFKYELKIGKAVNENHPLLVTVTGDFPKQRTAAADEKPEDKTRLDTDFADKLKKNEAKLAQEKKFEGRPYLVSKFSVDALLKDRAALLADKPAEPAKSEGGTPPAPGTPEPPKPATPAAAPAPAKPAPVIKAATPAPVSKPLATPAPAKPVELPEPAEPASPESAKPAEPAKPAESAKPAAPASATEAAPAKPAEPAAPEKP